LTPQVEPTASPSAEATQPPSAEAAEAALTLSAEDRRRIQLALTAQGFDTRGTDGTFGPRSREMIAAWQQAQKHSATGYLTAAESQALRDASPPQRSAADRPAAPTVAGGFFAGSLSASTTGGGAAPLAPMDVDLRLAGHQLAGRIVHPTCGSLPVSLMVDSAGTVSGSLRLPGGGLYEQHCFGERPCGGQHADPRSARRRRQVPRHAVVAPRAVAGKSGAAFGHAHRHALIDITSV
ncbi:MAG TPA: peptidoglycan-binding domain-containing protein, partial [Reyranella sp.]|nr:peptidoglycan-binding domain-containing protein [Reyranella sp.]